MRTEEFDSGYRGTHRPPSEGPGLHEAEQMYPDVHEHPEYYGGFGQPRAEAQSFAAIRGARGKPDKPVTMYRAAPVHADTFNTGDWVTPSRLYAQEHAAAQSRGEKWAVHAAVVPAKHLLPSGDSIHEYGYAGPPVRARGPRR